MIQRIALVLSGLAIASGFVACKRERSVPIASGSPAPVVGGAAMPMMPPGGMSVAGSYEGSDSTQMIMEGVDAGAPEAGRGRVDIADAAGALTVTLIDVDGGPPCVLRATRTTTPTPGATVALIVPGQTCTDQSAEGTIVLTTTAGSMSVAGNSLTLQLNGNVVMSPTGGGAQMNLTMVYNFTGMRH
jgi:hypothetical protein